MEGEDPFGEIQGELQELRSKIVEAKRAIGAASKGEKQALEVEHQQLIDKQNSLQGPVPGQLQLSDLTLLDACLGMLLLTKWTRICCNGRECNPLCHSPRTSTMSQKLLAEYHEVRTTSSITLNQEDGKGHASTGQTYKPGYEPKLYCVNHGRVNAWKLGHGSSLVMQLWESNVDPSSKYVLEQL